MKQTAIWNYDQFPYALADHIREIRNNRVFLEHFGPFGYTKHSRAVLLEFNESLPARLDSVVKRYIEAQERLRLEWEHIALREIPELINLQRWKNWKEENADE